MRYCGGGEGGLGVGGKKASRCCLKIVLVDRHLGAVLDFGVGESVGKEGRWVSRGVCRCGKGGVVELLEEAVAEK